MFIFLLKTISPMWHELMNSSSQHKLYFPAEENIQPPPLLKSVLIMRVEESDALRDGRISVTLNTERE